MQVSESEWEDKRARIEQTALSLFLQNGIENTSVNQITKQARIAKGTFYHYFKDKEELVRNSLIHQNLKALDQTLRQSKLECRHNGQPWAVCFTRALMDYYEQHPEILCFVHKNKDLCALDACLESNGVLEETPCIQAFLAGLVKKQEPDKLAVMRFIIIVDVLTSVSYLIYSGRKSENREELRSLVQDVVVQLCQCTDAPVFWEEETT